MRNGDEYLDESFEEEESLTLPLPAELELRKLPPVIKQELAFIQYLNGASFRDIGERFGVTAAAVQYWAEQHNWKLRREKFARGVRQKVDELLQGLAERRAKLARRILEQVEYITEHLLINSPVTTLSDTAKALESLVKTAKTLLGEEEKPVVEVKQQFAQIQQLDEGAIERLIERLERAGSPAEADTEAEEGA